MRKKIRRKAKRAARCKIVYFGNACWNIRKIHERYSKQYKCSDVILRSKYSISADVWSFACICFELACGDVLFDPHSGENYKRDDEACESLPLSASQLENDGSDKKKEKCENGGSNKMKEKCGREAMRNGGGDMDNKFDKNEKTAVENSGSITKMEKDETERRRCEWETWQLME